MADLKLSTGLCLHPCKKSWLRKKAETTARQVLATVLFLLEIESSYLFTYIVKSSREKLGKIIFSFIQNINARAGHLCIMP